MCISQIILTNKMYENMIRILAKFSAEPLISRAFLTEDLRINLQNSLSLKWYDPLPASLFGRTRLLDKDGD